MAFRVNFASYDDTKQRIIEAYESTGNDEDVEVDEFKISLLCAISKSLVRTPVRGASCTHLQCFDLDNFVGISANREKRTCPICSVEIDDSALVVDEYFHSILSLAAEQNASEVKLLRDGHFRFPREAVTSACTSMPEEVVDLSEDETEEVEVVYADNKISSAMKKTEPNVRGYILCGICGKRFREEADFNQHKSRAHPKVAFRTCTICNKRFYNEAARDNHEDTAHGVKTFKCDVCHKSFRTRSARSTHVKSCARKKRKKKAGCTKCGRSFPNAAALANHSRDKHEKKKTPAEKRKERRERSLAAKQKLSTSQAGRTAPEPVAQVVKAAHAIGKAVSAPTSAPSTSQSRKEHRPGSTYPPGHHSVASKFNGQPNAMQPTLPPVFPAHRPRPLASLGTEPYPPHGHYPAPTTFNWQPNTMHPTLPPVFHAYPPPPVPLFPPMMPPMQPSYGFYCPPPYQYGPVPPFPPPYYR
ncbi:CBN-GEI-17 protein [Aphelenchoides avenae]|nr:CBN-GEI-17 protein [Aphelenchus avenae]